MSKGLDYFHRNQLHSLWQLARILLLLLPIIHEALKRNAEWRRVVALKRSAIALWRRKPIFQLGATRSQRRFSSSRATILKARNGYRTPRARKFFRVLLVNLGEGWMRDPKALRARKHFGKMGVRLPQPLPLPPFVESPACLNVKEAFLDSVSYHRVVWSAFACASISSPQTVFLFVDLLILLPLQPVCSVQISLRFTRKLNGRYSPPGSWKRFDKTCLNDERTDCFRWHLSRIFRPFFPAKLRGLVSRQCLGAMLRSGEYPYTPLYNNACTLTTQGKSIKTLDHLRSFRIIRDYMEMPSKEPRIAFREPTH